FSGRRGAHGPSHARACGQAACRVNGCSGSSSARRCVSSDLALRKKAMRVLLTGFAPFPGVPVNATMALVPELAAQARRRFYGIGVSAGLLSTEWQAAPRQLEALVAEGRPDLILHFGVSARARGFEIEGRGQNRCLLQPDAVGALPASLAVRTGGPDVL